MFDLNNESEQKTGGGGCIPDRSIVKVRLSIRKPDNGSTSAIHPLVRTFKPGKNSGVPLVGFDCVFEVISQGEYNGNKFYDYIFLPVNMQVQGIDKGQAGTCKGGGAKMRAIVEAARGIHPADGSPEAMQAKTGVGPDHFQGMEFPAMVSVKKPQPGDQYINNSLFKVITLEDEQDYKTVMAGGQIITDKPLPEIPAANGQGAAQAGGYQQPPSYQAPSAQSGQTYQQPHQAQGAPHSQQYQTPPQGCNGPGQPPQWMPNK